MLKKELPTNTMKRFNASGQNRNALINIDRMVMIGAAGQNCGKTVLAEKMIKKWNPYIPIIALKVTTIHDGSRGCHRGIYGCGACGEISGGFDLVQENNPYDSKDTSRLLNAGASQVFWLRAHMGCLSEGFAYFLEQSMEDALIICESNSLRRFVNPGAFIMMNSDRCQSIKPSAADVYDKADICVQSNHNLDEVISKIQRLIFSHLHKNVCNTILDDSHVSMVHDLSMRWCDEKRIRR